MWFLIIGVVILAVIDFKKLIGSKEKGKVLAVYAVVIGISLLLSILIVIDMRPTSPNVIISRFLHLLSLGGRLS